MPGFPHITALGLYEAFPSECDTAASPGQDLDAAWRIYPLAKRVSTPLLLVFRGQLPSDEWIIAAVKLLHESSSLACVTIDPAPNTPKRSLCLDLTASMIRRHIFLESGGLSKSHQGIGDGADLGWRLWFMGYEITSLPTAPARLALRSPHPRYLVYRNWLWTLIRNCDETRLGLALSGAFLKIMARTDVPPRADQELQPSPTRKADRPSFIEEVARLRTLTAPAEGAAHGVSRTTGEALAVFHDMIPLLTAAFRERRAVQRLRRQSDATVQARLGQDPVQATEEHYARLGLEAPQAERDLDGAVDSNTW